MTSKADSDPTYRIQSARRGGRFVKVVATALCPVLRPQAGGYDYGLVVVVVVSFFS
jgi:hypothetical protein